MKQKSNDICQADKENRYLQSLKQKHMTICKKPSPPPKSEMMSDLKWRAKCFFDSKVASLESTLCEGEIMIDHKHLREILNDPADLNSDDEEVALQKVTVGTPISFIHKYQTFLQQPGKPNFCLSLPESP